MDITEKIRERWKWISTSSSPNYFLGLVILALFALSLVAIPLATSSDFVTQDARSLRRWSSHYAQNLRRHPIRRRLSFGPGSYPPRCMYKCGRCSPCYPVHVPVPPGTLFFPTEYYPEAWRCKCGNRLYMP